MAGEAGQGGGGASQSASSGWVKGILVAVGLLGVGGTTLVATLTGANVFTAPQSLTEQAAPSVSAVGTAKTYADSTSHKVNISRNGGGYESLVKQMPAVSIAANAGNLWALSSNVVTVTTYVAHGLCIGQPVTIASSATSYRNTSGLVLSCPTTTTFTFALTHADDLPAASDPLMTITGAAGIPEAVTIVSPAAATLALDVQNNAIGNTSRPGVTIENTTPSVASPGTTVQMSPRLRLTGSAWDTTATASKAHNWIVESLPATGATTTSSLNISCDPGTGSYTQRFTFLGNGSLSATNEILTTNDFGVAAAPGYFSISNSGGLGAGFGRNTTNTLSVIGVTGGSFLASSASALSLGASGTVSGNAVAAVATTTHTRTNNVATMTTAAHNLVAGQRVTISGCTTATYNLTDVKVVAVPSTTTFTYVCVGADDAGTADATGTVTALAEVQLGSNVRVPSPVQAAGGTAGTDLYVYGSNAMNGTTPNTVTNNAGGKIIFVGGTPTGTGAPGRIQLNSPLNVATGAAGITGTATVNGVTGVTVSTTAVTANSIIVLSYNTPKALASGLISAPVASITAGTSFVIFSSDAADTTSTVNWWILN